MDDKLLDIKNAFESRLIPYVDKFIFVLAKKDWKICEVKKYIFSRAEVLGKKKIFNEFLDEAVNYDYIFQQIFTTYNLIYPHFMIGGNNNG